MADKTIPALKILRGKVGINTATPDSNHNLTISNTANYGIRLTGTNATVQANGNLILDSANNIYMRPNSGYEVIIDSGDGLYVTSGNVGIGTASASQLLHVYRVGVLEPKFQSTNGRVGLQLTAGNTGDANWILYSGYPAVGDFTIREGGVANHIVVKKTSGSVGIGTVSPGSLLTISGNSDDGDNACALRIIDEDDTGGSKLPAIMFYGGSTMTGRIRGGDGTFAIAVGSTPTTAFSINTTSRKIAFGSYGSGTHTGTAAYKLAVDSSGNIIETAVGAGQVDGSGTANKVAKWTDSDTIGNSQITDNGTSVGINVSPNAANKLEVNGQARATTGMFGNSSVSNVAAKPIHIKYGGTAELRLEDSTSSNYVYDISADFTNGFRITDVTSSLVPFAIAKTTGSVGINTASPSAKLHVHGGNVVVTSGKQLISTNTYSQAPIGMLTIQGPTNGGTTINSDVWGLVIGPQHTRSTTANAYYAGIAFNHLLNNGGAATYNNAPQAWIGTRLHDTSGSERGFLVFATKSGAGTSSSDVPLERMCIDPVYGSIGIGTTDPDSQMQIGRSQTTDAFNDAFIKLKPSNTTNSTGLTSITFGTSTVDNYGYSISGWRAGTDGSPYLRIQRHNNSATGTDVMVMNNSGNIGIGTTDPSQKLHVIGAAFIDNTGTTGGLTVEASSNANITLQNAQNTAYSATLAAHWNYTTPMTLSGYGGTVLAQNTGVTKTLLYANNAEQIRITATGVGIGLGGSDPTTKLHVGGGTKIEGPLGGVLNSSITRIENFILDTKGEDAPVINHQLNNDLALLRVKGNTVTYSGLSQNPGDTETDRFFEANSYFGDVLASEISNASTGFTITLNSLPRNLTYTTRVGISFATPSWRCSYVKIEVYRAGAWTQIREETSNSSATVYQYYNTGSDAITKIRYTLKTPVTTSLRIVSLFAFNYNSTGATGYYLSQAGGSVYGNVGIGTNNPSCLLQLGTNGVQGGASLAIRRNGDSINFGHANGAGYGSVIGCSSNNGQPHIGFMCEAGTNINTFRTRGLKGNVIYTNTSGTLYFAQVTNANADNQSLTNRVAIESDGDAFFYGGNWYCNHNNSSNVTNGGLYINRGGGLYAYALATARSGTALNGVDFWDYHGVGLVFGPDSSTKVLTVKSNIGIGTTNPGYILDVRTASLGAMQVKGSGNGLLIGEAAYSQSANYTGLKTASMTGAEDYMIISGTSGDGNTYVSAKSGNNLHLRAGGNNSGNEMVVSTSTGITYKSGVRHEFSTGNVGINTSTVNVKLAVAGQASFGDQSRLSLIGLNIASGAASPNVKIRTKIPFALGGADFTVNIKGFIYGNAETANLTVCWHYYNSTFYNATCSSAGGWAPTIQLSAEDWDSSGTKKVCICLSTPGYWVKMYVESMFSNNYADTYADGWTWVDGTASGTGNDLASLSYRSDFGNNFRMLSSGSVGVGVTPSHKFQVNGTVSFRPNGSSNNQHYFTTSTPNNPQYLMYNSAGTLINKFAVAADSYFTGGSVGIGTNSPAKKLHVAGSTLITNNNYHYGYTSGGAQATLIGITDSNNCIVGQNNANIANTYIYGGTGDINLNPVGDVKVNNADLFVDGNVGIASASPAATLDVKQGTANNNNKLMKVADDVLSVYKVTGLSNHTVTLTCGSYFQAEVVITANQTNGGTYNNLYIRGIWSNNHHSHHWDEIENIGSLSGSSFSIAVSANDVSNSGKLTITHSYSSGSFSQMVVRVTDLYGVHSYSIT